MAGVVDQLDGEIVAVELQAKDGHYHQAKLPIWVFPCAVEEGLKFSINFEPDTTIVRCTK